MSGRKTFGVQVRIVGRHPRFSKEMPGARLQILTPASVKFRLSVQIHEGPRPLPATASLARDVKFDARSLSANCIGEHRHLVVLQREAGVVDDHHAHVFLAQGRSELRYIIFSRLSLRGPDPCPGAALRKDRSELFHECAASQRKLLEDGAEEGQDLIVALLPSPSETFMHGCLFGGREMHVGACAIIQNEAQRGRQLKRRPPPKVHVARIVRIPWHTIRH